MFIGVSSRLGCGFSFFLIVRRRILFFMWSRFFALLILAVMILYFSGVGNSRKVAECAGKMLGETVFPLTEAVGNKRDALVLQANETLGFVFPVYSWGPPAVVLGALERLHLSSIPAYVYFICTCGDDTGKTADIFRKAVRRKGWECHAGFSVTMPNTYVCLPGFNVDSSRLANLKLNSMKGRVEFVASCIRNRERKWDCHEGAFPRLKSYVIRPLFNRYMTSPKPFHAEDTCISCGKCEQVCPMHNIRLVDRRPVWGADCALCLACYHHCPKHAVAYGGMTRGKGQFTPEKKG